MYRDKEKQVIYKNIVMLISRYQAYKGFDFLAWSIVTRQFLLVSFSFTLSHEKCCVKNNMTIKSKYILCLLVIITANKLNVISEQENNVLTE